MAWLPADTPAGSDDPNPSVTLSSSSSLSWFAANVIVFDVSVPVNDTLTGTV